MKSEHRHELKTNELADWIAHFPKWANENRIIIIGIVLVIAATVAVYIWKIHRRNVMTQKQMELTTYMSQVLGAKTQIMDGQAKGVDRSFILLQPANSLNSFAQTAKNNQMAAFALIKRAEALRTELHYRLSSVNQQDFTTQINLAKDSYNEAIKKAASSPSLLAEAKFGLGLCEEELGNFEAAQQIYQDVASNPDFDGTVAKTSAKRRLETMVDYKKSVVFIPSVQPKFPASSQPKVEIKPVDINTLPLEIRKQFQDPNRFGKIPTINVTPKATTKDAVSVDANQPNN